MEKTDKGSEELIAAKASEALAGAVFGVGLLVDVEGDDSYAGWVEQQQKPAEEPTSPLAQKGKRLFVEKACARCHNEESPTFKGFEFEERWAEIAHPVPEKE